MISSLCVPVSDMDWACPIRALCKVYEKDLHLRYHIENKTHPHSKQLHSYILLLLANNCKRYNLVMSDPACFKPQH